MVIAGLRLYMPPTTREFANLSDTSMPVSQRCGLPPGPQGHEDPTGTYQGGTVTHLMSASAGCIS